MSKDSSLSEVVSIIKNRSLFVNYYATGRRGERENEHNVVCMTVLLWCNNTFKDNINFPLENNFPELAKVSWAYPSAALFSAEKSKEHGKGPKTNFSLNSLTPLTNDY